MFNLQILIKTCLVFFPLNSLPLHTLSSSKGTLFNVRIQSALKDFWLYELTSLSSILWTEYHKSILALSPSAFSSSLFNPNCDTQACTLQTQRSTESSKTEREPHKLVLFQLTPTSMILNEKLKYVTQRYRTNKTQL